MSSLNNYTKDKWKCYVKQQEVHVVEKDHRFLIKLDSGVELESSPRSFRLCYKKISDKEGVYQPVSFPVLAARAEENFVFVSEAKERMAFEGDYLLIWESEKAKLEQEKWNELQVWTVDAEIFEKRYNERAEKLEQEEEQEKKTEGTTDVLFGFCSLQGKRDENEDCHLALGSWNEAYALFGVFDGHGGEEASAYGAKKMPALLQLEWSSQEVEESFKKAFVTLDKKYISKNNDDGSTVLVSVLDKVNQTLYVANAGDSRAIVITEEGKVIPLSTDHKPADEREKNRIEAALFTISVDTIVQHGKRVKVPRIDGKLAVSRAIGDDMFKDLDEDPNAWAVTPVPEVQTHKVNKGDLVILACDGLWDVCENEDVLQWVLNNKNKDCEAIANELAQHAIDKGSDDNVTVVVVKL